MGKAIFTFIITAVVGLVFMAIGNDLMKGLVELGILAAVSVAAGLIVLFSTQKKKS